MAIIIPRRVCINVRPQNKDLLKINPQSVDNIQTEDYNIDNKST